MSGTVVREFRLLMKPAKRYRLESRKAGRFDEWTCGDDDIFGSRHATRTGAILAAWFNFLVLGQAGWEYRVVDTEATP